MKSVATSVAGMPITRIPRMAEFLSWSSNSSSTMKVSETVVHQAAKVFGQSTCSDELSEQPIVMTDTLAFSALPRKQHSSKWKPKQLAVHSHFLRGFRVIALYSVDNVGLCPL